MCDPAVAAVPVRECGEPLRDTKKTTGLLVDGRKHDPGGAYAHGRSGLLARLVAAEAGLPEGLRFLVIEGYRPLATQRRHFESYQAELTERHPAWTLERIQMATSRYVSPPEIAPHCAGAAIDLTLCTHGGSELDMGTRVNASPEDSDGACYTTADVEPSAS